MAVILRKFLNNAFGKHLALAQAIDASQLTNTFLPIPLQQTILPFSLSCLDLFMRSVFVAKMCSHTCNCECVVVHWALASLN